jgi:hypothetical protein
MNFMVYLNGLLQPNTNYTIDVDGNLTAVSWAQAPGVSCLQGDIVTIMFYDTGGIVLKRVDNICDSNIGLGNAPTYSSSNTTNF